MKLNKYTFLLFFLSGVIFSQSNYEKIYVAAWNLENLFDNVDDPDKNDEEWLTSNEKGWNEEKIEHKIKNLSKVIRYMNECEGPDILGVEEVEHQHLLDTLIQRHFCDRDYRIAYAETKDNRGIDCGLIYDADKFDLKNVVPHEVLLDDGYPTRYVLQAHLISKGGNNNFYFFVNHWPSRRGGEEKSRPSRIKAAETLLSAVNSIKENDTNPFIFIMGDFNDEPDNVSIKEVLGAASYSCDAEVNQSGFYNLASELFSAGEGSYLFRGDWNMLDQLIVSASVIADNNVNYICKSFEIIKPEFMITQSGTYKGAAIPTFGGRTYLAGFSDHYPVGASFLLKKGQ